MQNNKLILPTTYLGPISYYRTLLGSSTYEIEAWESFPKQTLRNRCHIMGANGVQTLSIPVCKVESKQFTKDVRINYQADWQHQHWNALRSAYEHTPFFAYYADYFRVFYEQHWEYLLDYNMGLHEVVLALLRNQEPLCCRTQNRFAAEHRTASLQKTVRKSIRSQLTETWGEDKDLDRYFKGSVAPYHQIFADKNGFQENLSIVDLLFNLGPEAALYYIATQQ